MHHEVITMQATAPGSGGAAAAAVSGDSLTVRAARAGSKIVLLDLWADKQTAGFVQITAPTFSDTTRGIRCVDQASEVSPLFTSVSPQLLTPQDTISGTIAGSGTPGDIETACLWVWYEDVPGLSGMWIGPEELRSRGVRLVTVMATLALGTGGGYSGSEAINAESDLLRANTLYAVLGASHQVECAVLGIRSPDWSNVRVPVPGNDSKPELTNDWFVRYSRLTGLPLIPVFNSANRANVLLDGVQDENGADAIVSVNLVELSM